VSEQALERLSNLASNPYTWILFIFIMSLPYILKYLRRFYPEKLRKKMDKEEACTLEYQQKPEMKFVRKIILIGMLSVIFISYFVSFYFLTNLINPLATFRNLFLIGALIVVIIAISFESKIKKDENCNEVVVGYKYLKFPNFILTIIVFSFIIVGIFYLIGIIFPPK